MRTPPPFPFGPRLAVPTDIDSLDYHIHADIERQVVTIMARLDFQVTQAGCPIFDMVPVPIYIHLNGRPITTDRWKVVIPPDEFTQLRVLDEELPPGVVHRLDIWYELWEQVVFTAGGVAMGFFMTDLEERGYLERYGPANLEYDQLTIALHITLSHNVDPHQVFANGVVEKESDAPVWHVTYPAYFTCSSCYFHLTNKAMSVRTGTFKSVDGRRVPLTVYGTDSEVVATTFGRIPGLVHALEAAFGAYAHGMLLIYSLADEPGGMEYAGAAMTGYQALRHELTHSWFARGVMPANGNAGWIDEAIAEWQGRDFAPAALPLRTRAPSRLAGFSPYRRHTPRASYSTGAQLLAELDHVFPPNGLRYVLALLFAAKKRTVITTEDFKAFLTSQTSVALDPIFDRYVYGDPNASGFLGPTAAVGPIATIDLPSLGIEPFTKPKPAFSMDQLRAFL